MIALNHVGANSSIIFDGNTLIFNKKGILVHKGASFKEDFLSIDTDTLENVVPVKKKPQDPIALIHNALILGIKDFFRKNGFSKAVMGLSGGIDSALVAALTAEALGKENVLGILIAFRLLDRPLRERRH